LLKGLALQPSDRAIIDTLTRIDIAKRDFAKAAGRLGDLLERQPNRRTKMYVEERLARFALLQKDYRAAERHLNTVLGIDGEDYPEAYRLLAYLRFEQGRTNEARQHAEKALAMQSNYASKNTLAWVLVAGNLDVDRGLTLAQDALWLRTAKTAEFEQLHPYSALPEVTLGVGYLKKRDLAKAVEHLERAASLVPDRPVVRDSLREAQTRLKRAA
jgi:tetratricopeptide (TPR) repeat protein